MQSILDLTYYQQLGGGDQNILVYPCLHNFRGVHLTKTTMNCLISYIWYNILLPKSICAESDVKNFNLTLM